MHFSRQGRAGQGRAGLKYRTLKRSFIPLYFFKVNAKCSSISFYFSALSAGLAAPLIGAGAVAVLGSGSAAIFTGASGLAVITSIFGAAGAGLAGTYIYSSRL